MLPETLQKLKETELGLLMEFDRVCKHIGVRYTLSSGTLLGAVRHRGFIPWDDDIDVAMLREDYDKFLADGHTLLPEHLFIQTYETDPCYPHHFGKIRDLSTVLISHKHQHIPMRTGVYIDIFPIDQVSSNTAIRWLNNIILRLIWLVKYSNTLQRPQDSRPWLKGMIKNLLKPLARIWGIQTLNRLENWIRTRPNLSENDFTFADNLSPPCSLRMINLIPVSIFHTLRDISFEERTFQAIQDTHTYLSAMYGDYMTLPPLSDRVPVHDFIAVQLNI